MAQGLDRAIIVAAVPRSWHVAGERADPLQQVFPTWPSSMSGREAGQSLEHVGAEPSVATRCGSAEKLGTAGMKMNGRPMEIATHHEARAWSSRNAHQHRAKLGPEGTQQLLGSIGGGCGHERLGFMRSRQATSPCIASREAARLQTRAYFLGRGENGGGTELI